MARIFISYNRESKAIAITLAADLDALGHTAWFDQEIIGGRVWWDQILAQVRECDVFVVVLNPETLDSVACKSEYGYAADLGKSILPVLVSEQVSTDLLPPALSQIQFVDYLKQDRDAAFRLARALNSIPAPGPLPSPLPVPPQAPISYLGSLTERVESTSTMSYEEQSVLVADLRRGLRDPGTLDHTQKLLAMLRKRRDLFATFAEEVDELMVSNRRPQSTPLVSHEPGLAPGVSSDTSFVGVLSSAKSWALDSAHLLVKRVVWPETILGAALRGAIIGLILCFVFEAIINANMGGYFGNDPSFVQSPILWAIAGAISRRSPRASLIAFIAAMVWSLGGVFFRMPFQVMMIGGGLGAILVAIIALAWGTIRALKAR